MQINLTGHHVEITSSLKEYVNTKVNKLERHFDRINNIRVVLTVEKSIQTAEATLLLTGSEVFASADNEDMYTAIDSLIDKLDKQLL
ncbi:MAG: ribosome-associated translation inhibitor RaiA, partial [Alteromonadaceae bacterium]